MHPAAASTNLTVHQGESPMWILRWPEVLWQDLRYAGRTLAKSPGFILVAVLTLALGIGANTAIFSVVNAVVLQPLPYMEPSRLVVLIGNVKRAQVERRGTSYADYFDWRDQSQSFDGMSIVVGLTATLTGVDDPERVTAEYVARAYFPILGVNAAVGRIFRPEEDRTPQHDAVAVISDGLWRRRFGGDPAIAGRTIMLNDRAFTVVGVMPAWFRGVNDNADLWVPLMMVGSAETFGNRGNRGPNVLARLKPGVSLEQAQAEMTGICKRLEAAYPGTNEARGVEISPLETELRGNVRAPLLLLLAAVGLVLMIACTNVANLQLARSEARQREIAVRIALGASRGRVLHQLTTESFVLVFIGAAAGLVLARWGVGALIAASPITFPSYMKPGLDPNVALFTIAISCAAALLLGLAPALHVGAGNLNDAVKQAGSRTIDTRKGSRFRNVLVTAEVALAMLLLVGAGLLIRSLRELATIRPGYDPNHVLVLRVSLPRLVQPAAGATPDGRAVVKARDIVAAATAVPSVESAALGSDGPLTGASAIFYTAEGQAPVNATNMPRAYTHRVSPNFFQTLRIPFMAGRTFTDAETQPNSSAVIVSENLVKRFWPGQDPIGKRIKPGRADSTAPWMTIVGVANEMKYRGLPNNPTADPDIFLPFNEDARNFLLVVRTPLDPASIAPSVRGALRAVDSTLVVYSVTTMQELMAQQTAPNRFTGWIMGIFAASALLLAMIGIYGVMSYAVSRRTQEIGIRMALGAARCEVLGMMVRRGMRLVLVGLTLGIAGGLGLSRLLGTLLYGVTPTDIVSFGGAALALAAVALLACLVPAIRASRIDPAIALRNE
jgi:putative ABC transport system permease protein